MKKLFSLLAISGMLLFGAATTASAQEEDPKTIDTGIGSQ